MKMETRYMQKNVANRKVVHSVCHKSFLYKKIEEICKINKFLIEQSCAL